MASTPTLAKRRVPPQNDKLNTDVLGKIFVIVCSAPDRRRGTYIARQRRLVAVCRFWRALALSHEALWKPHVIITHLTCKLFNADMAIYCQSILRNITLEVAFDHDVFRQHVENSLGFFPKEELTLNSLWFHYQELEQWPEFCKRIERVEFPIDFYPLRDTTLFMGGKGVKELVIGGGSDVVKRVGRNGDGNTRPGSKVTSLEKMLDLGGHMCFPPPAKPLATRHLTLLHLHGIRMCPNSFPFLYAPALESVTVDDCYCRPLVSMLDAPKLENVNIVYTWWFVESEHCRYHIEGEFIHVDLTEILGPDERFPQLQQLKVEMATLNRKKLDAYCDALRANGRKVTILLKSCIVEEEGEDAELGHLDEHDEVIEIEGLLDNSVQHSPP